MPSFYWIKLYHEILDDPKVCRLSDRLYRRMIELFLLAGDYNKDGLLPSVDEMAWRLRLDVDELIGDLYDLEKAKIVHWLGEFAGSPDRSDGWIVTKFEERQRPVSDAERMQRYRKRKQRSLYYGDDQRYEHVTKRNDDSYDKLVDTDIDIDKKQKKKREDPAATAAFHSHDGTAQKLYMQATNLTYIPPDSYDAVIETAKIILDQTADFDEAVRVCKAEYARWCSTKRKDNHGTYSKLNPAWMTWVLEKLAPRPEGRPRSMSEMTDRELKEYARQQQMEAKK